MRLGGANWLARYGTAQRELMRFALIGGFLKGKAFGAVTGGIAAELGGGKFRHGAYTSAFAYVTSYGAGKLTEEYARPFLEEDNSPIVIEAGFEENSPIPEDLQHRISEIKPELSDALRMARIRTADPKVLQHIANKYGLTEASVAGYSIHLGIYIPAGEGVTINTLVHETVHIYQRLTIPGVDRLYQREMERKVQYGNVGYINISYVSNVSPYGTE